MRSYLSGLAFLVALSGGPASAADVEWLKDYNKALAQARAAHKLVLLVLRSETCPWCDKLDQDTLRAPQVVALAAQFVPLHLFVERNSDLGRRFARRGVPQTVFLDADGQPVRQVTGFVPAAVFVAEMNRALENQDLTPEIAALEQTLAAQPDDPRALARLGHLYVITGQESRAEPLLRRALAQAAALDAPTAAAARLDQLIATLPVHNGDAAPGLREWVAANATHPRLSEGKYYAGYASAVAGEGAAALALWAEVIKAAPESVFAALATHYTQIVKRNMERGDQ